MWVCGYSRPQKESEWCNGIVYVFVLKVYSDFRLVFFHLLSSIYRICLCVAYTTAFYSFRISESILTLKFDYLHSVHIFFYKKTTFTRAQIFILWREMKCMKKIQFFPIHFKEEKKENKTYTWFHRNRWIVKCLKRKRTPLCVQHFFLFYPAHICCCCWVVFYLFFI